MSAALDFPSFASDSARSLHSARLLRCPATSFCLTIGRQWRILYGVGFGPTTPTVAAGAAFSGGAPTNTPVTVTIGGLNAPVAFAGLIEAGLYQINLTVPPGTASGDQPIQININGVQTPAGTVVSVQ